MSSRKYRSLRRNGQHSWPAGNGREAFFLRAAHRPEGRQQGLQGVPPPLRPARAGFPGRIPAVSFFPVAGPPFALSGRGRLARRGRQHRSLPAAVLPGKGPDGLRHCGKEAENRFDFSVLRRPMPRCRKKGR